MYHKTVVTQKSFTLQTAKKLQHNSGCNKLDCYGGERVQPIIIP